MITIYGDPISGNCLKVKWTCERLAIPFTWIDVNVVKRETRTAAFLAMNPAGQVPTIVFENGQTLAQSNAIIRYLARDSDLVPNDAFAAAQMDAWLFWEQYSHETAIAVARYQMVFLGHKRDQLEPRLIQRGWGALEKLELGLKSTPYLVGAR